jgi:uncharacterized membrane protein YqjE
VSSARTPGSAGIDLRPEDPTQPVEPDETLSSLLQRMTRDVSDLVSTQIQLAKVELREDLGRAGKGAGMLGGGAFAGYLAVLLLSFALAFALDEIVHTAVAFLIVGLIYAVIAAVLFFKGRDEITTATPVAEQTTESLKEDMEWVRQQKS